MNSLYILNVAGNTRGKSWSVYAFPSLYIMEAHDIIYSIKGHETAAINLQNAKSYMKKIQMYIQCDSPLAVEFIWLVITAVNASVHYKLSVLAMLTDPR